jgi:hypothetical protein
MSNCRQEIKKLRERAYLAAETGLDEKPAATLASAEGDLRVAAIMIATSVI